MDGGLGLLVVIGLLKQVFALIQERAMAEDYVAGVVDDNEAESERKYGMEEGLWSADHECGGQRGLPRPSFPVERAAENGDTLAGSGGGEGLEGEFALGLPGDRRRSVAGRDRANGPQARPPRLLGRGTRWRLR